VDPSSPNPSVHQEIERKYDVDESLTLPDLTGVAGVAAVRPRGVVRLEAVYYDTADHRLAQARVILRRRTGGGDEGWHIKRPASEGLTELRWPLTPGLPAPALEELAGLTAGEPLTPLARISTLRDATELLAGPGATRGNDGRVLAEVADDRVRAEDLRRGGVRSWREWEVELGDAAPPTEQGRLALLDEIETHVLASGARHAAHVAKIARALRG